MNNNNKLFTNKKSFVMKNLSHTYAHRNLIIGEILTIVHNNNINLRK